MNINIHNNYSTNNININIVNKPSDSSDFIKLPIQGKLEEINLPKLEENANIPTYTKYPIKKGRAISVTRKKTPLKLSKISNSPNNSIFSPKNTAPAPLIHLSNNLENPKISAIISPRYGPHPFQAAITPKRNNHNNTSGPIVIRKNLLATNLKDCVAMHAVRSRPGCTPGNVPKINQDNYICLKDLNNMKNVWLFGVFDGHGLNGHFASDHVKKFLAANIEIADNSTLQDTLNPKKSLHSCLLSDNIKTRHAVLVEAFKRTNDDIKNRSFDVTFSGTTAVTVLLAGNKLICANVGDSRAIIASYKSPSQLKNLVLPPELCNIDKDEKIWLALPISRDHKPDDPEESKRIVKMGGRIDPFRENNGEPVGPCRVWLKKDNVPGLAMSRSIGDNMAASVGVTCEPEIFEMQICSDDKFLILASDGIWEFLGNDQVVEIVVPFWQKRDPEGACQKLINEALHHWQTEDDVVDDITVIVIFFGGF